MDPQEIQSLYKCVMVMYVMERISQLGRQESQDAIEKETRHLTIDEKIEKGLKND